MVGIILALTPIVLTIGAVGAVNSPDNRTDGPDIVRWKPDQAIHLVTHVKDVGSDAAGDLRSAAIAEEQLIVRYVAQWDFSSAYPILEDRRDDVGQGVEDVEPKPDDPPDKREPGLAGADPKPEGSPGAIDPGRVGSDPESN